MRTPLTLLIAILALVAILPAHAAADRLSAAEERGRQIYHTGTSRSGRPITAYFGPDLLEVPGESATCVSCHGHDGLGRSEGGVQPSNITWPHLVKSFGHIHAGGRHHPPFSEASLTSYLQDGTYPGGTTGDPAMPVYDMGDDDLRDLVAYCRGLGSRLDPGLSHTAVRIGLIVSGQQATAADDAARAMVRAYFDHINATGGVYGRQLELVVVPAADPAGEPPGSFRHDLFALLGGTTADSGHQAAQAEAMQIPLLVPYAPTPAPATGRYLFALHAGLRQQVQALLTAVPAASPPATAALVIYPRHSGLDETVATAETVLRDKGWHPERLAFGAGEFDGAAVVQRLNQRRRAPVLFLGGEREAAALFAAAGALEQLPDLYLPGPLIGASLALLPAGFRDHAWLAYPALPTDRTEAGLAEINALAARQGVTLSHPTPQITAYAGAKLLVEGLRRAGRALSRERLVDVMEGMFEVTTGVTQPVSFDRNRRIGTLGAHIVTVDPSRAESAGYVTPRGWVNLKQE